MRRFYSLKQKTAVILSLALLLASSVGAVNMPLPSSEATSSITALDMKRHLSFLASDELGGRYTLSPSNLIAARYLATQLESYGYKGAAKDGSFFQKVPLSYRAPDLAKSSVTLTANGASQELKYGEDFGAAIPVEMKLSGELVFVGYGVSSPKNKHDDYAGLDVKGKIVVFASELPAALREARVSEAESGETAAAAHGAAGAIVLHPIYLLQWGLFKNQMVRESIGLPPRPTVTGKPFYSIIAGPSLARSIAKAMGKEESYLTSLTGAALSPAPISASVDVKIGVTVKEAPPAQNVVGILEGADPRLKEEFVVFSAHFDHLQTTHKGEVYNGADDDGSGTVAVLEIAQAFSTAQRSKRSVLIIFHTAEEMGLYGSEFNTDYEPVIPLSKLVADFNIDMIGRSRAAADADPRDKELTDKDSIYIIGADKLSTELNRISEHTNAETARLRFDYTFNDENHPQQFYYRSDHYNYAKHGIPIIFYFTGVHRDYHRTTDDVGKIDFEKMERITRMILATGWRVANLDHRVVVDKKPVAQAAAQ